MSYNQQEVFRGEGAFAYKRRQGMCFYKNAHSLPFAHVLGIPGNYMFFNKSKNAI